MKKKIMVGLLAGSMTFGVAAGVYAGSNMQEIKAYLNGDIQFKVHGADWRPKDTDGNEMMPITYEGSTYVPLRAVSNALNAAVDYDPKTDTVILGEKVDGVNFFSETIKLQTKNNSAIEDVMDKSQLILNKKQYSGAYRVSRIEKYSRKEIQFDLSRDYSKLHLVIGSKKGSSSIKVVNGIDQILGEFNLKEGEVKEVDIDIIKAQYPKIVASTTDDQEAQIYIFKETTVK